MYKRYNSTVADINFKFELKQLVENGNTDENPRPKWKDGTPAHTLYNTDIKEKYHIQHGDLPFSTLRNVAVKTGIREILWIYQQQSNLLSDAHKLGIKWWDEFDIGDGTIGQRYGATVKKYNIIDKLLNGLVFSPFSRRHIIDMWQFEDFETAGLNPCMYNTTFMVRKKGDKWLLDVMMKQR